MTELLHDLEITKLVKASECEIKALYKKEELISLIITFRGPLAHFPSTSNAKVIKRRFINGEEKRFIGPSEKAKLRLKAAETAFGIALKNANKPMPTFGASKVHVLAFLAKHSVRRDSHNAPKPICDWLEDLAIVKNDSQIEMIAVETSDYKELDLSCDETTIIIQKYENVYPLLKPMIGLLLNKASAMSRAAQNTGYQR